MDNDAPGSPLPPPRPRSASGPEVRALPWISAPVVGTAGIVTFSVVSGFFALWVFSYVMGVFNVTVPAVPGNWIAILLAGLAWGGGYVIVGYRLAAEWPDHLLGPLTPYLLMTEADGPGDVVLSFLSASPLNVFLSWGAAVWIGVAASDHLGADQSGVIFLVFGLLTAISLTWFTLQDA